MRAFYLVIALLLATACGDKPEDTGSRRTGGSTAPVDADGDGIYEDNDCNDEDPTVYPGADEICDGIDNNCDDTIDEDAIDALVSYRDQDGDGFGDADAAVTACEIPNGYVSDNTDCDDDDDDIHPDSDEVCNGLDDDCDGLIDDDDDSVDLSEGTTFYADTDADGYGDPSVPLVACVAPEGYRLNQQDCDDASTEINPGATEICNEIDDNCDSLVDDDDPTVDTSTGSLWFPDSDGDGFGDALTSVAACTQPADHFAEGLDCDDGDDSIHPDATEICDLADTDENCDGAADDADPAVDLAASGTLWFPDSDSDGFGSADDAGTLYCDDPSTGTSVWLTDSSDCDDGDAGINPDASEVCDPSDVDENCNGSADDADSTVDTTTSGSLWYPDSDEDGHGDASDTGTLFCDDPSSAGDEWVSDNTDCDDTRDDVSPSATEVCDASDVDEDCDGTSDDADTSTDPSTTSLWYPDADVDGFGDASDAGSAHCDDPSAGAEVWLEDNTDCDDSTERVHPDQTEICDGLDNDCDATTPESGLAAIQDSTGTWSDVTSSLTGTSSAPAVAELTGDGNLYICDGSWYLNLAVVAADATITGLSGSTSTILNGGAAGTVLSVDSASTVVASGLTIENGSASDGAGIYVDGGDLTADDVVVQNNLASAYGGGVFVTNSGSATLEDCQLSGNTADRGAGAFATTRAALSVTSCDVIDNIASTWGGGLEVYTNATLEVEDSVVDGNTAGEYGGGVECNDNGTVSIVSSDVTSNAATSGDGGGVDVYSCSLTLDDVLFDGNSAGASGGGVYADSASTVTADALEMTGNAAEIGGAIAVLGGIDLTNSDLYTNAASDVGGAIWVDHSGRVMSFTNIDFSANTPDSVYSEDTATAYSFGLGVSFICNRTGGCF